MQNKKQKSRNFRITTTNKKNEKAAQIMLYKFKTLKPKKKKTIENANKTTKRAVQNQFEQTKPKQ